MRAYIYCADIYCEDCGKAIRKQLRAAGNAPEYPRDEYTYDSDEYPKGPFSDGGGESDCPQHCGSHSDCVNAIELSDGSKVGAWLENPLTTEGARYVQDAIRDGGEVAAMWAEWYADEVDALS